MSPAPSKRPPKPPSATRERVLEFVRQRVIEGAPPTVREVQRAFGWKAVQSAQEHLAGLLADGRLVKEAGQARGYRLPEGMGAPRLRVPLLGRVQAGALTGAVEEHQGYVSVAARGRGTAGHEGQQGQQGEQGHGFFALRVRGASMVGAGILDGDLVVVRRQQTADEGDIVVARVGDEATVKRLRLRRGHVELQAENPAFPPIVIAPPDELALLGKVVEVRRVLDGHGLLDEGPPPARERRT